MYKSYTAFRGVDKGKRKYCNWSREVVPIQKIRKRSGEKVYLILGEWKKTSELKDETIHKKLQQGDVILNLVGGKWKKAHDLQKVKSVIKLEPDEPLPVKARKQAKKRKPTTEPTSAGPVEPKYRKVKSLEIDMKGWKPRRSKRIRKKINYKE